jgi:FtsX extracellular domain
MSNRAESAHGHVMLVALLSTWLSLAVIGGCGGQTSVVKSSPTPQIAPFVAANSLPDPATSSVLKERIVSVYLRGTVKPGQRAHLADQIAKTPGVQEYAFVSRNLTMIRFLKQSGSLVWLRSNPFPTSFEIVVRSRNDVLSVARRFFDNPLVDSTPGHHDGVAFTSSSTSP